MVCGIVLFGANVIFLDARHRKDLFNVTLYVVKISHTVAGNNCCHGLVGKILALNGNVDLCHFIKTAYVCSLAAVGRKSLEHAGKSGGAHNACILAEGVGDNDRRSLCFGEVDLFVVFGADERICSYFKKSLCHEKSVDIGKIALFVVALTNKRFCHKL